MKWILERHAALYPQYDPIFLTYVEASLADYDADDPRHFLATEGGCIAIVHDPDRPGYAKLRWFFVEPEARGQGAGTRLLATALGHARRHFDGVHLWTMSDLASARRLYERAGFRLVEEKPAPWHETFVQQRFELSFEKSPKPLK